MKTLNRSNPSLAGRRVPRHERQELASMRIMPGSVYTQVVRRRLFFHEQIILAIASEMSHDQPELGCSSRAG